MKNFLKTNLQIIINNSVTYRVNFELAESKRICLNWIIRLFIRLRVFGFEKLVNALSRSPIFNKEVKSYMDPHGIGVKSETFVVKIPVANKNKFI